jgi:3-hydroxyisobutyrate dehydrogenase/2-hydroxy-3-oxopropionate reductase
MGAAMVARLVGAGHDVTVYNRTSSRAEGLGATVAPSPRDAVASCGHVVVSLADDNAVRAAYTGADGLIAGLDAGTIVCDTSTIHPGTVRELAGPIAERGATLLDTPVSGSVSLVQSGQLTVLVGGPTEAVDRAREVLGAFGARIIRIGPIGTGATMKLAVNSALHGLNQAVAEALVLAERAGVDREVAYDVFANSAVGAPFLQYKREAFLRPDATPVAFSLDLAAKDLRLVSELAKDADARMPQVRANVALVEEASRAGYGDRDFSALAAYLRA